MTILEAQNMSKTYGNGVTGLAELDLKVGEGEVFAFLGPNGAGKTTTVRLCNGTLEPTRGGCTLWGKPAAHLEVRAQTATMSEDALMYESMTLQENLVFYAALYSMAAPEAKARARELADFFGLGDRLGHQLGSFSTGMRKRAALARCLMHRPRLLFLDEPTSGLDPQGSREVMDAIAEMTRQEGTTVFLCTHNLPLVESYCSRIGFIKEGRLVAYGTRDELVRPLVGPPRVRITWTYHGQRGQEEAPADPPLGANSRIAELIGAGKMIESVIPLEPDLEAVYRHYIGGAE